MPAVYPRVCGGTQRQRTHRRRRSGLSPRMRGNRGARPPYGWILGSIPAYAGEPYAGIGVSSRYQVYPRVCGGTRPHSRPTWRNCGLSPRMRGNPGLGAGGRAPYRSIPAYAGEPLSYRQKCENSAVYPRVCGGTLQDEPQFFSPRGLSPRMRGNHKPYGRVPPNAGSIPAYAGEP